MRYLACIAEKYTKRQLSEIVEVRADGPHKLPKILEEKTGMMVDGESNYVDYLPLKEMTQ